MDPRIKKIAVWAVIHPYAARPRWWVRVFVTPFTSKRGRGSMIRSSARLDILPNHRFELGYRSIIESYATINNGVGDVVIKDNTRIGLCCTVIGPAEIGSNVRLAQNIVISGLNHNYQDITKPITEQGVMATPIVISDDVWIGANSVITAGVTIGRHSVIAAGSVVTHSIPDFSIAAGSPAKVIKQYDHQLRAWVKKL